MSPCAKTHFFSLLALMPEAKRLPRCWRFNSFKGTACLLSGCDRLITLAHAKTRGLSAQALTAKLRRSNCNGARQLLLPGTSKLNATLATSVISYVATICC